MNPYIGSQITNMIIMVNTFKQACLCGALKDDGTIDKLEEKQLKRINKAVDRFIKELNAISK